MKWNVALPSPVEVPLPRCTVLVFQVTEFSGPVALAHDSSALSLEILGELSGPLKAGALFGLGNWEIGNDPAYNIPGDTLSSITVDASRRSFSYMGNAADGTSGNYGVAA